MFSIFPAMIQAFEGATLQPLRMFPSRDPDYDAQFYDTAVLTPGERAQAYASNAQEGSIVIVQPGRDSDGFDVCACDDDDLEGEARARDVVGLFAQWCERHPGCNVSTLAIAGCGSSPVGAVAMGKTVAEALGEPVAAIVSGRGQIDAMWEVASGGSLMGPMARFVSFVQPLLDAAAGNDRFAAWARHETRSLCAAIQEAGTLLALLRSHLVETTADGLALRPADQRGLRMIVGHSKANWAVLVALLNLELDIIPRLPQTPTVGRHIDVVTFGNPVDLPNAEPMMRDLFHYHQFMGSLDILGMMNVLPSLWLKWCWNGQLGEPTPQQCGDNPVERLIIGCKHGFIRSDPAHMPIERLLPLIRDN